MNHVTRAVTTEHGEVIEDDSERGFEFLSEDFVSSHVKDFHVVEADGDKIVEFKSKESLDEFAKVILKPPLLLIAESIPSLSTDVVVPG